MTVGRIPVIEGGIQPTIFDAKADLLTATANDTPARLAVGANNTVLTVDSSTATGLKWATPAAGGKVLQVITSTNSTARSTTSTTFVDAGLSVTITPAGTGSRFLLMTSLTYMRPYGYENDSINFRFLRDATAISASYKLGRTGALILDGVQQYAMTYLDSPATASAIVYKLQYSQTLTSATAYLSPDSSMSTLTVMEIGA
jgi:hypothetical protein